MRNPPTLSTECALLFSSLLLAGCAHRSLTTAPSSIITVNEQQANQLVTLHLGDKLVVDLPLRNGGQWQLLQSVTPVLLTDYAPGRVTAYEGRTFQQSTLSNGRPSSYVFVANTVGTELLQFATGSGTGYTGGSNTYTLRVRVAPTSTTAAYEAH